MKMYILRHQGTGTEEKIKQKFLEIPNILELFTRGFSGRRTESEE